MTYSDTYTGPRWTYGSTLRPFLSIWGYFDGWILLSDKPHPDYPTFGTIQTSKPIPDETARHWDLILIEVAA